jgi:hypothetical protein
MQVRMLSARGAHGYPPSYPPRPSDSRSPLSGGFTASSPPRKVVTDFAAFGAAKTSSVYGTAVQSTPFSLAGNKAAFGSLRTGTQNSSVYDDDDEDEEQTNARQKVLLREDPITLDQVRSSVPLLWKYTLLICPLIFWQRGHVGSSYCYAERMAWYYSGLVCLLHTFLGGCRSFSHWSPHSTVRCHIFHFTSS